MSLWRRGEPKPTHPLALIKVIGGECSVPNDGSMHFIDNCLQPDIWKEIIVAGNCSNIFSSFKPLLQSPFI